MSLALYHVPEETEAKMSYNESEKAEVLNEVTLLANFMP